MTTAAIVLASVFAYVVVAGRVYRWAHDHDWVFLNDINWPAAIMWPLLAVGVILSPLWRLGATPRRRSELPEARVRR